MGWGPGATCHTRAGDPGPRDTHCPPPERNARSLPPCALLVLEQFTSKMCGRKHACFFLSPAPTMTGPFPLRQWLQDGARLHGDQTAWGDIGVPMRRASRPALENTKSVSTWAVSSPTSQGMPPAGSCPQGHAVREAQEEMRHGQASQQAVSRGAHLCGCLHTPLPCQINAAHLNATCPAVCLC